MRRAGGVFSFQAPALPLLQSPNSFQFSGAGLPGAYFGVRSQSAWPLGSHYQGADPRQKR